MRRGVDRSHTWPLRYNVLWQSGGKEFSREFTYEAWAAKFALKKLAKGAANVRIHDKVEMVTFPVLPNK